MLVIREFKVAQVNNLLGQCAMYFVAVKVKISTFVILDIQERVKRFKFSKKGQ